MRAEYLVSLCLIFAVAIVGQKPWLREAKQVTEPARLSRDSHTEGPRLFLTSEQSDLAATEGLLPKGTRSILNVGKRLRYGDFVWNTKGIGPGPLAIRVDLNSQLISVFRGGNEIGVAVILYGSRRHETPVGRFPILAKLEDHRSATYDAPMPFTLRLTTDGVAIHGSEVRWGVATHGCIGVPLEFAGKLFRQAAVGDVVEVVAGGTNKVSQHSDRPLTTTS